MLQAMAGSAEKLDALRVADGLATSAFGIAEGRMMVELEAVEGEEAELSAAAVGGDGATGEDGTAGRDDVQGDELLDDVLAEGAPSS